MRNLRGAIAATAAVLLLTACTVGGAGTTAGDSTDQDGNAAPSVALDAGAITKTLESLGLICTEEDPRGDGREESVQCKGDDYMIVTATRFTSPEELNRQADHAREVLCEGGHVTAMVMATSGSWAIVPGGERDKDIAMFDEATNALGLESTESPCEG